MVMMIRLLRFGHANRPYYRLVVINKRRSVKSHAYAEELGRYDPILHKNNAHKYLGINTERMKYWLTVGAQPTETVKKLLGVANILPKYPSPGTTKILYEHDFNTMIEPTSHNTVIDDTEASFIKS